MLSFESVFALSNTSQKLLFLLISLLKTFFTRVFFSNFFNGLKIRIKFCVFIATLHFLKIFFVILHSCKL